MQTHSTHTHTCTYTQTLTNGHAHMDYDKHYNGLLEVHGPIDVLLLVSSDSQAVYTEGIVQHGWGVYTCTCIYMYTYMYNMYMYMYIQYMYTILPENKHV